MENLMTLEQLLKAIQPGVKLSVVEGGHTTAENELIRLYSGGEEQLSAEILARNVDAITVMGKTYLQIHLTALA